MRITELLDLRSISLDAVPASKQEALDMAVALMAKSGKIRDEEAYRREVYLREEESTTGVGGGIAIPHGKCDAVIRPGLAAMVIPNGVDFDSLDGEPVHLIFLIAAPNTKDNVHLDVLSKLSVLLMDEQFSEKLRRAKTAEEFLRIVDEADAEKPDVDEQLTAQTMEEKEKKSFRILAVTSCPEHVGGFLQIVREESAGIQAVCLPDLFTERWMSELLALLLLQDLSRSCFLPGKAVTLSGLMEVLLTLSCPIRLLKRGDQVGDIQVLWPQKTRLRKDLEETLGEIGIPGAVYEQDRWMWKELVQVAARMREIFMRLVALSGMEEIPRNGEHIPVELEEEVRGFRADFRKLRRNERFLGMAERFQESVELLRTFHDRTGLIFHVGEDGKENFLYTGNGWKEWAVWLEKNEDGLVPLHRKYWCISVPGHGTDECYWDFAPYAPRHFLVSNGYVAGQESGKISGRYAGMFAVPGVIMHCTSSNWCEGNKDGICSCWDAQITSPELCSVIREEETKSQKRKEDETA